MKITNVGITIRELFGEVETLFTLENIDWDTDDEDIEGLPTKLNVWAIDAEHAFDCASDETGWRINGVRVGPVISASTSDINNAIG